MKIKIGVHRQGITICLLTNLLMACTTTASPSETAQPTPFVSSTDTPMPMPTPLPITRPTKSLPTLTPTSTAQPTRKPTATQTPTATVTPVIIPTAYPIDELPDSSGWDRYSSEAFNFTIAVPPTWTIRNITLDDPVRVSLSFDSERLPIFGEDDGLHSDGYSYSVYVSEYSNPDQKTIEEIVNNENGSCNSSPCKFLEEKINNYTVYRTHQMPSMKGALTVIFAGDSRFLAFGFNFYKPLTPFFLQNEHVLLFEAMLHTVQLSEIDN